MALKVGDLYVLLSAQTSGFGQGLQSAAQQLETFTARAKKSMREIGRAGRDMSIAIGAAIAIAAQSNVGVAMELNKQKQIFATFANEIATAMLPVLREMGQHLMNLLGWWQQLNPETKASISHWVGIATAVGLAAGVFAKVLGVVHALLPVFEAIGAVLASPMFVPILIGIAALAAGIALVHKAWRENWGGMQDATLDAIATMAPAIEQLGSLIKSKLISVLDEMTEGIARVSAGAGAFVGSLQAGRSASEALGAANDALHAPKAQLLNATWASATKAAGDVFKKTATDVKDEWLLMTKDLRAKIESILGVKYSASLIGGHPPIHYEGPIIAGGLAGGVAGKLLGVPGDFKGGVLSAAGYQSSTLGQAERSLGYSSGRFGDAHAGSVATGNLTKTAEQAMQAIETQLQNAWAQGDWAGVVNAFREKFVATLTNVESIIGALKVAGDAITSKLGKLGETIQAGVQGFQQGGIWGALAAVILQFVTAAKGFTQIMNIGNGQFQMALNDMSKGLGDLFNGLKPLMGAIESIASAVHQVLNPVFSLLGVILKGIAPIFEVVGVALQVVAGTLGPLIQIVGGILDPLFKLMGMTLSPLIILFMYLKVATDGIALGFNKAIDAIDKLTGNNNQGGVDAASAQFETDKAAADKFALDFLNNPFDAINNLENQSADTAAALGNLGNTADTVSQQLLNVPQGFKVALAEFAATQAVGTSSSGGSATYLPGMSDARKRFLKTGNPVAVGTFPRTKP